MVTERLQNLETAVTQLSASELREFAAWFAEFDQEAWERQIEGDAKAGRLDFLREEALREKRAGRLRDL